MLNRVNFVSTAFNRTKFCGKSQNQGHYFLKERDNVKFGSYEIHGEANPISKGALAKAFEKWGKFVQKSLKKPKIHQQRTVQFSFNKRTLVKAFDEWEQSAQKPLKRSEISPHKTFSQTFMPQGKPVSVSQSAISKRVLAKAFDEQENMPKEI